MSDPLPDTPRTPKGLNDEELAIYEERVAICFYDGEVSARDSERIAWQEVQAHRRKRP